MQPEPQGDTAQSPIKAPAPGWAQGVTVAALAAASVGLLLGLFELIALPTVVHGTFPGAKALLLAGLLFGANLFWALGAVLATFVFSWMPRVLGQRIFMRRLWLGITIAFLVLPFREHLWGAGLVWIIALAGWLKDDAVYGRIVPRGPLALSALTGLLAAFFLLPYAAALAEYTFSGPTVRDLPNRSWLVAVATLAFSLAIAFVGILSSMRHRFKSWTFAIGGGALAASSVLFALNKGFQPNEYEPIHRFMSGLILLFAAVGFFHLWRWRCREPGTRGPALGVAFLVALVALAGATVGMGAKKAAWGFAIWGETGVARYLPTPGVEDKEVDVVEHGLPIKPAFDGAAIRARRAERAKKKPPHFVLFYIDNVQTDHVGVYGYTKNPTTPHIDALGKNGAVLTRAYSTFPQTRNFASQFITGRAIGKFNTHAPPASFIDQSLTRLLKKRGYAFFIHNYFDLSSSRGFDPKAYGVDTLVRQPHRRELAKVKTWPNVPVEGLFDALKAHLDKPGIKDKPAFIWVHLIWPHWKRNTFGGSPEFDFGNELLDHYDSAIAASDAWIPKFKKLIEEKLPNPENTIWMIGSDHGAGVTRKDPKVGKTLYEDHVHVPWIISGPGIKPGVHDMVTDAALDGAATVLDLAGIAPPKTWDGMSLVPILEGSTKSASRAIPLMYQQRWKGMVFDQWKYIAYGNTTQLFALSKDPLEAKNVADDHPALTKQMAQATRTIISERMARFRDKAP
jgi:arylsulfatase A-like enzyme